MANPWDGSVQIFWDIRPSDVRRAIQRYVPVDTGALRQSIQVYRSRRLGETAFVVTSALRYAWIQNFGGEVPAVEGKLMVFMPKGSYAGEKVFTMKRSGFYLKGSHFMEHGIDDIVSQFPSLNGAITARWPRRYARA